MNLNFFKLPVLIIFVFYCCLGINAQNKGESEDKPLSEITGLRQNLIRAIEKRDRAALETFFTDDFTHTHAVGRVDGKPARLDAILSGDTTLESITPDEMTIRFYGKDTAVAVGQSTIEKIVYRWTIIYVKGKKGWRVAASQASKKS